MKILRDDCALNPTEFLKPGFQVLLNPSLAAS